MPRRQLNLGRNVGTVSQRFSQTGCPNGAPFNPFNPSRQCARVESGPGSKLPMNGFQMAYIWWPVNLYGTWFLCALLRPQRRRGYFKSKLVSSPSATLTQIILVNDSWFGYMSFLLLLPISVDVWSIVFIAITASGPDYRFRPNCINSIYLLETNFLHP